MGKHQHKQPHSKGAAQPSYVYLPGPRQLIRPDQMARLELCRIS